MRLQQAQETQTPSLSGRRNGRGGMTRGKATGREEARMERAKGKEEAKPVVAKEDLPKEAASSAVELIGPPSVSRTTSTRAHPMPPINRQRGVICPMLCD